MPLPLNSRTARQLLRPQKAALFSLERASQRQKRATLTKLRQLVDNAIGQPKFFSLDEIDAVRTFFGETRILPDDVVVSVLQMRITEHEHKDIHENYGYEVGLRKDGKIHGKWEQVWDDGMKIVSHYQDGKKNGKVEEWYTSGEKKSEGYYQDGKKHGQFVSWYKNGQKKLQLNYRAGIEHGKYVDWFKNGKKQIKLHYCHGKMHGKFTRWSPDGHKQAELIFRHGVCP